MDDKKIWEIVQRMALDGVANEDIQAYFSRKNIDINDWLSKRDNNWNLLPQNNEQPIVQNNSSNEEIPDWNAIAKADANAAGEKYQETTAPDIWQDIRNKLVIWVRDAAKIKGLLPKIISSIKVWATKLDSKAAHWALWMLINSKWLNLPKWAMPKMIDAYNKWLWIADLPAELSSQLYKKIWWTVLSWLITDVLMGIDVNKANKQWLNKDNRRSGIFDAVDSATETLPVFGWIDLAWDAAWASVWNDENWENYYRWWLLTKLSNMVEQWVYNATDWKYWDNTARTFWENNPEKQAEDKKAIDWMKERGYKWWTWWFTNFAWNSTLAWIRTKKNSQARRDKEDSTAIDKIQNSQKWKWLKSAEAVDKQQQDKRDANLYISYHNQANWKNIDSKWAYSYKDFTKDFKQDENWTWVNKKTWQTANEMRKTEKWKIKKEWETINI